MANQPPPQTFAAAEKRFNMSIDADPQQQEAASPQVLVVRSFLRWAS